MAETTAEGTPRKSTPQKALGVVDAVAFCVGVVIGVGIFRTPPIVAANTANPTEFLGAWVLGGLAMLAGMLCYAELASRKPHAGGEYHFLREAFGHRLAVLFAWARGTVIQTGAIAAVAFVFGDYAEQIVSLGPWGAAIWGIAAIVLLTVVNVAGTTPGKRTQIAFSVATVVLVVLVAAAGLLAPSAASTAGSAPATTGGGGGSFGLAMVLVLLTYGGWNEIAYLSGEMRDVRRDMVRTALIGTAIVTAIYLAINIAYLQAFGFAGLVASKAVGADLMRRVAGETGAVALSIVVGCAALSTLNATIFTGARAYYALGTDVPAIRRLGVWSATGDTPANALWLQALIAVALVGFGAWTRDGFGAMVDYTAPVFWFFLTLTSLALFVLRAREGTDSLPFRVPLYPLTPAFFTLVCVFLLYSSLDYTRAGALFGVAVLIVGLPLVYLAPRIRDHGPARPSPQS